MLARAYIYTHRFPQAYAALQQARLLRPHNPSYSLTLGILHYQMGQLRDALDSFSEAIRNNPSCLKYGSTWAFW